MSDVSAANDILRLFSDRDGLTRAECESVASDEGWTPEQCDSLVRALGTGANGSLTDEERAVLLSSGYRSGFIEILRGADGLTALRNRVEALSATASYGANPLDLRLEAIRELSDIFSFHPALRSASIYVAMASDPDTAIRAGALEALGGITETSVIPILRGALSDPEPRVRRAAAGALGSHGEDAAPAIPELTDMARSDEDEGVRERAVRSLGAIGLRTEDVVSCLRDRASDPVPSIRRASITALVRLHSHRPSDIDLLVDLADDPDRRVRDTVDWALRRLVNDADPDVQAAAQEALENLSN